MNSGKCKDNINSVHSACMKWLYLYLATNEVLRKSHTLCMANQPAGLWLPLTLLRDRWSGAHGSTEQVLEQRRNNTHSEKLHCSIEFYGEAELRSVGSSEAYDEQRMEEFVMFNNSKSPALLPFHPCQTLLPTVSGRSKAAWQVQGGIN